LSAFQVSIPRGTPDGEEKEIEGGEKHEGEQGRKGKEAQDSKEAMQENV
jgi:hypothetical protein